MASCRVAHKTKAGRCLAPCGTMLSSRHATPNLPTQIVPNKICWLKLSGKCPMDMRIPPLRIKIKYASVKPSEIQNLSTEIGCTPDTQGGRSAWTRQRTTCLLCVLVVAFMRLLNYSYMICLLCIIRCIIHLLFVYLFYHFSCWLMRSFYSSVHILTQQRTIGGALDSTSNRCLRAGHVSSRCTTRYVSRGSGPAGGGVPCHRGG